MDTRCLHTWNYDLFIPGGSSATKVVNKTALPTFIHTILFLCASPHSLNWAQFHKWEMFAPLASITIPQLDKGYKIWHKDCYFKSPTSASDQQERVLHSNLPPEPPPRTWLASASAPYRAKKQITSTECWICSPSQKPLSLLSAQPHYKVCFPSFDTKKFSPSLIARETLSIMLKLP